MNNIIKRDVTDEDVVMELLRLSILTDVYGGFSVILNELQKKHESID